VQQGQLELPVSEAYQRLAAQNLVVDRDFVAPLLPA
jgi:hypothetical protein